MSKHDTWVYFKVDSPYAPVEHLFPDGFPMRDPFPMAHATDPLTGEKIPGWVPDMDRMTPSQLTAVAELVAKKSGVHPTVVIREGFLVAHEWVERMEGGPECYQRSKELADFLESGPLGEQWNEFYQSQERCWINGNETPPPLPQRLSKVDSRFLTPAMVGYFHRNRLPYVLGSGGKCPQCDGENTTYNPEHGFRTCEDCGNIWGRDEDDPDYDEELLDLGACCACGKVGISVRNLVTVERRASVPGTGWGCFVCNLPHDGALAVVCDDCLGKVPVKQVCHGYPAFKERIDIEQLPPGRFAHTEEMHERFETKILRGRQ